MKLGIINGWEEAHFKSVRDKGLEAVEFCINHNYDSAEVLSRAEEIKGYSDKYGVSVGSIGRWGMDRVDDNGEIIPEAMQHDKNLVDLASKLGCPVYNVGCNEVEDKSFEENCRYAINYLSQLVEYAKQRNVKIGIYNCDWANFIWDAKSWGAILTAIPELGIKYDPSHCINRFGDYLKEMADWGHRFHHFHIKGTLHVGGDHYDDPPAGLDQTNWGAVMAILHIHNYKGMLSIEPHSSNWFGYKGQWGIDFTINYIRQFLIDEKYESMDVDPYMP